MKIFETDDDRTHFLIRLTSHKNAAKGLEVQVTGQATGQVKDMLRILQGEMSRSEIQASLGLAHRDYFTEAYLQPALADGLIEMTIPDKPRSSKQRYRLTHKGLRLLAVTKTQE